MRSYEIDLPQHVLHFSLPEEMAREMSAKQVERRFDPFDPSYLQNGFRIIAGHLHDFKGPFWVGAYGSLKVTVTVVRREREYTAPIVRIEELKTYWDWRIAKGNSRKDTKSDVIQLGNTPWVCRRGEETSGATKEPSKGRRSWEVISSALDNDTILVIALELIEWVPGSAKAWMAKGDALCVAIRDCVRLEPKPTAAARP